MPGGKFDPVRTLIPKEQIARTTDCCDDCDGFSYGIPLRDPVIELRVSDLTNEAKLIAARDAMRMAIEVERQNITHNYHLGIFASHWFTDIVTNDVAQFRTCGFIYRVETWS